MTAALLELTRPAARPSACSTWRPVRRSRARSGRSSAAPGGEVVLSDIAAGDDGDREAACAEARGLTNVQARESPISSKIDEPDALL